jgi:hypothetical protein
VNNANVQLLMQEWNRLGLPDVMFVASVDRPELVYMKRNDLHAWMLDIVERVSEYAYKEEV